MRVIIDKILWGMLVVLFIPTVMIVASWNALPGESMYGTKIALERAALALASPSYATSGTLQIKYTERRFAEAKQLMASKQSIQGLPYLEQQIAETKKSIKRTPNKQAQIALAKQYINTLTTVSTDLEAQKQTITASPQTVVFASPRPTVITTHNVKKPANTSTSTPNATPPTIKPPPAQVTTETLAAPVATGQSAADLQITQTQQNVDQTIADLQTLVNNDANHDQNDNNSAPKDDKKPKENTDQKKNDEEGKPPDDESKKND